MMVLIKHTTGVSEIRPKRLQTSNLLVFRYLFFLLIFVVLLFQTTPLYAQDEKSTDPNSPTVIPPKLIGEIEAIYPKEAFDNNIEDAVGLSIYIDSTGAVAHVEITNSATHTEFGFDESAVYALKEARFKPATKDGEPIAVKIQYTYPFKIHFIEPKLKEVVQAKYPTLAIREGMEDAVEAEIEIDEKGTVTDVQLVVPAEHSNLGFEKAALDAMSQFDYEPATKNGKPIAVRVHYRYTFELPEKWVPIEERPVNVEITIKEKGTRKPITSGYISLKKEGEPAIEESFVDGKYLGRGLEPGDYTIQIDADGYESVTTKETIPKDKKIEATYIIEKLFYDVLGTDGAYHGKTDYEYETRETKLKKEVSIKTLKVSEIQRIPGNNGDAIKVVQNLPGVARSTFNTGALVVRGASPSDTQVLINGSPIPMLYHFGGISSTINSDALEEINFIPGNFSVKYGRAMGGVLDVKTRRPNKERYSGYIDIDAIDASLMLEGPITDNLSFQVSARRSYIDFFLKQLLGDDASSMKTAPRYWDYNARLNWISQKHYLEQPVHEVELMGYGSNDRMLMLDDSDSFDLKTNFYHVQATWKLKTKRVENSFLYDFGKDYNSIKEGQEKNVITAYNHAIREEATFKLTDWLSLTTGADIRMSHYKLDILSEGRGMEGFTSGDMEGGEHSGNTVGGREGGGRGDTEDELIRENTGGNTFKPALFAELNVRPIDRLLITTGTRFDYDSISEDYAIDLRGSTRYSLNRYLTFKGGIGSFSQAPQDRELSQEFGNPDLGYQKSMHYSLGTEFVFPFYEALFLDVTGFYKTMDSLVVDSDQFIERDGLTVPERFNNDGKGRVWGGEFMLRHNMANNFFGWISYTLSRSERKENSATDWHSSNYDQTHILTLLGSYKLPKGFNVGLRYRYVSGTPYTPLSRGAYDSDADKYQFVTGKPFSARTKSFQQLDIRIDKDFVFDNWILTAYLDVQNVLFRYNEELTHYNFDFSEQDAIEGLPFLPSFGVRGAF